MTAAGGAVTATKSRVARQPGLVPVLSFHQSRTACPLYHSCDFALPRLPRLIKKDWEDPHANAPNNARLRRNDRGGDRPHSGLGRQCRRADQGHHRQGDRRRRLPRADLCRARRGLLQSRRARRRAGRIAGQRPGDRRAVGQSRLRADPVGRRTGGAERRKDRIHRRRVAQIAVDRHHAARDRQTGGSQGQDAGFRPAWRRRLRRGAGGAAPLLPHGRRQGLQGDLIPRRGRTHRRHGQQRHPGRRAIGSARRRGRAKRSQGVVAYRRLYPARRRHHLVHAKLRRATPRYGQEDRPRHRQGGYVFPHQQGRLDQGAGAPYRQHQERRPGRRHLGSAA